MRSVPSLSCNCHLASVSRSNFHNLSPKEQPTHLLFQQLRCVQFCSWYNSLSSTGIHSFRLANCEGFNVNEIESQRFNKFQ